LASTSPVKDLRSSVPWDVPRHVPGDVPRRVMGDVPRRVMGDVPRRVPGDAPIIDIEISKRYQVQVFTNCFYVFHTKLRYDTVIESTGVLIGSYLPCERSSLECFGGCTKTCSGGCTNTCSGGCTKTCTRGCTNF
jgi:hypothetical protein